MTQPPLPDALMSIMGLAAPADGGSPATEVTARLHAHLGPGGEHMEILKQSIPPFEHVNFQLALEKYIAAPGCTYELIGVRGGDASGMFGMAVPPSLEALLGGDARSARLGSVAYVNRPCGPDQTRPCIERALLLIDAGASPLAVWIAEDKMAGHGPTIEVVCSDIEVSRAFLAELGALMRELNIYRGQVLSLSAGSGGGLHVGFQERFGADRDAVVLPPGVLEALEDQTIGIGELREELLAAGRHLKRGVLLYGPPGTGKTHTVRYLASRLVDYTVLFLTGSMMSSLRTVGDFLPLISPAVVVFDDVDLIAEDRNRDAMSPRQFLFDLLDLMDGLQEDLDVVFVLTTNRIDSIETAIAARPGRIDQAVEIPLPDADALARLLEVYGRGVELSLSDQPAVISRLEGVTASFIRELFRRAVLLAVRESGSNPVVVRDEHVHAALDRLLDPRSPLTSALLGRQEAVASPRTSDAGPGGEWCPLS